MTKLFNDVTNLFIQLTNLFNVMTKLLNDVTNPVKLLHENIEMATDIFGFKD